MIMFLPEKKRVAKSADDDHGYKEEEIILLKCNKQSTN